MTAAFANGIRSDRIRGRELPNRERREAAAAAKKTKAERWTFDRLWTAYQEAACDRKPSPIDASIYKIYLAPVFALTDSSRKLLDSRPRIEGCPYVFPGRGGGSKREC